MTLKKLLQLAGPVGLVPIRLKGPSRFHPTELSALYIGNRSNLDFLSCLFFRQTSAERLSDPLHPVQLRSALARFAGNSDLILSELPPLWSPFLPGSATIRFPAWMRQEITLTDEERWILSRRLEREVDRQIRRNGYVIDSTVEQDAMRVFFRDFYRPYVQSRFGPGSVVADEETFMSRCQGQTLARLRADGRWVAGLLIKRRGQSLRFGRFGASSNPPAPGASEVLDTLVIRAAHAQGVRRIVMGDSRPCLADGVVRYKARFGAKPAPTLFPQPTLCIEVRRWSEAVAEALRQQPLVTIRNGAVFVYGIQGEGAAANVKLERAQP